jgi:hypothetical protein
MGMELTPGQTRGCSLVTGTTTRCMVKEYSLGLMAGSMRVSIMMIKNKDSAFSLGLMEEDMKDSG